MPRAMYKLRRLLTRWLWQDINRPHFVYDWPTFLTSLFSQIFISNMVTSFINRMLPEKRKVLAAMIRYKILGFF